MATRKVAHDKVDLPKKKVGRPKKSEADNGVRPTSTSSTQGVRKTRARTNGGRANQSVSRTDNARPTRKPRATAVKEEVRRPNAWLEYDEPFIRYIDNPRITKLDVALVGSSCLLVGMVIGRLFL